jgi:endo-1,4-beta-xylanase
MFNHKLVASLLIASAAMAVSVFGQTAPATAPAAPTKGLKDVFSFMIGTAADPGNYSDAEQANIKQNYNIITPENCMKPQPIHPSEDTYNYAQPDALVKWASDNHIKIHGHTLAWHSQTANWFFTGNDKQVVLERLHKHISNVVGHFKGKLYSWDVVNEAINDGGGGGNGAENLRSSQWFRICGPEFLTDAFKWAHEADPDVNLYYNDYNIEQGALRNNGKHAASLALLKRLIKDGAPINGVGIQGHWSLNTNVEEVDKAITDYEELGLKIAISELDVTVQGGNSGAMPGGRGGGGAAAGGDGFKRQADVYAKLFEVFKKHSKSITRVTFWGINDRRSWRSGQNPLIFDGNMVAKPAFQSILDVGLGKTSLPTTMPQ